MLHESKCKNLHGHRYVVEITAAAPQLDDLGRVVDFSVIKKIVGGYIDRHWDHGTIAHQDDFDLIDLCAEKNWKLFTMFDNPTAENMARALYAISNKLLADCGVEVVHVRLYETPNCWADYSE
jgi:6-pyruvoyltetrahydropterin/6-carboxytetrahydropterin synthase